MLATYKRPLYNQFVWSHFPTLQLFSSHLSANLALFFFQRQAILFRQRTYSTIKISNYFKYHSHSKAIASFPLLKTQLLVFLNLLFPYFICMSYVLSKCAIQTFLNHLLRADPFIPLNCFLSFSIRNSYTATYILYLSFPYLYFSLSPLYLFLTCIPLYPLCSLLYTSLLINFFVFSRLFGP